MPDATAPGAGTPAATAPGLRAVGVESPNKPRPDDPLLIAVADTLRRIEINYDREGSGPGSRFEGQLLEDVQARTVVKMVLAWPVNTPEATRDRT